ncbi:Gldg family protein [filamentous cyanobacterium LEGE 11480]|uniref:Gldg family protein n=1 Tax=Romeriopsis navalis LEGE 11480 TaxID=2777977 RepID=A0A928Z339_9CYAN|nr:Gldg family protein [Romeriopsis navalis]MBE9029672.1 Gldg family protein [Romeriopsis navalis LEGE 11480]
MKAAIKFCLKYAVFLGVGLASAGLIAGLVSGNWDIVATGLIIAGIVLMGVWLLFIGRLGAPNQPNFWQRRSTQVGTNALVSTLSVLAILGLINFVAVRNVYRADITETQQFSLAPETKQVLKGLKSPVKMYLFTRDADPNDRILLDRLTGQTKQFSFEYVDPQTNPTLAQRFKLKNDLVNKDVFLERFSHFENRPITQLVQSINPEVRLSESKIVNSLIRVTSDRRPKIYFLQGHGEKSLKPGKQSISAAVKGLTDRNFQVEPLSLAQTGEVPTDAAVIVVAGPQQPLFEPEIKLLTEYQRQGGNLLVLLDPRTETGIDPLLKQWGIVLDNRLAIDASGIGKQLNLGPAAPIVQTYSDHPITRSFSNSISFYPYARPLEILEVPNVRPNPIVITNDKSWADADPDAKPVRFGEGDRMGPLPIGVALSRVVLPTATPSPTTANAQPSPSPSPSPSPTPVSPSQEARMVVFGNTGFAMDGYFNQAINGDVLLNSISWLSQDDAQPLSVRPRSVKNRRIIPSQELVLGLFISAVIMVPLLGLITAIGLWWRRR